MSSDAFSRLDRIVHEKGRMAIMSSLAATSVLSFKDLRDLLRMTDGNLSVHLRTLQEAGYLAMTKSFVDRKPLTTCTLTSAGRLAFEKYIEILDLIVRQHQREFQASQP